MHRCTQSIICYMYTHTHTHTHTLTCINYTGGPAVGGSMGTTPPAGWLPALPTFGRTGMVLPPGGPPPLIRLPASSSASMSVPTIAPLVTTGMFMGHTLLPLPPKLVKKIVSLEYVDMSELRPESWLMEEEGQQQGKCCHAPHRKKSPVKDILTWVQCFASYVSVLAQPYPSKMPQLMAYMCTIIRIEKDFEDNAWQNYDMRQAAITKSLEWGNIEPTLYSMAVTGHSKRRERCFSPDHHTHACPIQQQQQPGLWVQQPNRVMSTRCHNTGLNIYLKIDQGLQSGSRSRISATCLMPGRETDAITRSAGLHTAVQYVGAITRGPDATGKDSRWRRNIEEWREELRGPPLGLAL